MKIISSASAFYKNSPNDFCGAANPIVQSLLTKELRLSRKSSSALRSNPNNKDLIFLPMAILGSTEWDLRISFTCVGR
jgi:hypothetical protein